MNALELLDVSQAVKSVLSSFVQHCEAEFGDLLVSVSLFGSASDGRMDAGSDVNVLVVAKSLSGANLDKLREPMRAARAAVRLEVMWLCESELEDAFEDFAVKFADMTKRHVVLFGRDVLTERKPSREAQLRMVDQVLLNFVVRKRAIYVLRSLRAEQLAAVVATMTGPLRSSAAAILELEGNAAPTPHDALPILAAELGDYASALDALSNAHRMGRLDGGQETSTYLSLLDLADSMRRRLRGIR